MIIEGVNFNAAEIALMTAEEFEQRHIDLFWLDRDIETRKKMLSQVYELVKPVRKSKKKNEE